MNLLVTGAWAGAKENLDKLRDRGHDVLFLQQEKDPLPCDPAWVEGVICNGLFLHHAIEQFDNLRFIQLTSAGTDRIPTDYVYEHGIALYNAAGVYSVPMAEFAVSGVLQLYKQSRFFFKNQTAHRWEKHRGLLELSGKTVCIVGCGSVGSECAKRFQAFGCRVLGVNRTITSGERRPYYDQMIRLADLEAALKQADIVILSIALTEETRHLMNADRLAGMKPGAVLVNISRGAIVDQEALIHALPELGGAVLDVFEDEPLPEDSPLWDMENVILTPHNSFVGDGNRRRLDAVILNSIDNYQGIGRL